MGSSHRRRIETENKAKCFFFLLGVKNECRTRKIWCESVALYCTYVLYIFPLLLLGGGTFYVDLYFQFLNRNSKKSQTVNGK